MTDEEYFKYIEPLSPAGMKRLLEIMDVSDEIDLELSEAKAQLTKVLSDILDAYERAMGGEALSEDWEEDIEHAASVLAKYS